MPEISNLHVLISQRIGQVNRFSFLNSTRVNGQELSPERLVIYPGDHISLGGVLAYNVEV